MTPLSFISDGSDSDRSGSDAFGSNASSRPTLYLDTTGTELMLGISLAEDTTGTPPTQGWEYRAHSDSQRYHSAMIIPLIRQGLAKTGISIQALGGVAINIGPGSFTGIRTGVITARTMGQFMPDVRLHAFNSFELLATPFSPQPVSVYLDARRGRAYFAKLQLTADGFQTLAAPSVIDLNSHVPDSNSILVVSPSLLGQFKHPDIANLQSSEAVLQAHSSPSLMQQLLTAHPDAFLTPWASLTPLYLEAPNITISKKSQVAKNPPRNP